MKTDIGRARREGRREGRHEGRREDRLDGDRACVAAFVGIACALAAASGRAAESPFAVITEGAGRSVVTIGETAPKPLPRGDADEPSLADETGGFLSYHGVLVDGALREIELSPEFVDGAQDELLVAVAGALGERRLAQWKQLDGALFEVDALEHLDRPKLKSRLIEIWLDELDERGVKLDGKVRRWRDRHAALRLNLPDAFGLDGDRKHRLEHMNRISRTAELEVRRLARVWRWPWLEQLQLEVYVLIPIDWYFPPSTPYIDDCRAAGVPIPPDWGDSRWEYQGVLDDEFIDAGSIATVYAYRSAEPEGSCIALPRTSSSSGDAGVFGIICLGIETENACFWDKYSTSAAELAGHIPIEEWISGSDFTKAAGNCSSCHAGENPFVIHPDTPLDIGAQGFPIRVDWHDPLLPPTWADNPGPLATLPSDTSYSSVEFVWWDPSTWFAGNDEAGSSCVGCHALPDVAHPDLRTEGYCTAVLAQAAARTMPPDSADPAEHPAGWGTSNDGDYQVHLEALDALCD